jgi:phosphoketolase
MSTMLDDRLLAQMAAYWRASNYLSVGQIYLLDNPRSRSQQTTDMRR